MLTHATIFLSERYGALTYRITVSIKFSSEGNVSNAAFKHWVSLTLNQISLCIWVFTQHRHLQCALQSTLFTQTDLFHFILLQEVFRLEQEQEVQHKPLGHDSCF